MHSVNDLIVDTRSIFDDGRDYTACVLDNINAAARARTRTSYVPPIKAAQVSKPVTESGPIVKIGERASYGRNVCRGIYELELRGRSADYIAIALRMPLGRVEHILKHDTGTRRKIYQEVNSVPAPAEREIMKRMAAETRA
ncbi:hypothetical protein BS639_17030 [Rouxiella silvae]|uniref:Phage protein n=1 Tax=Rouxiella silvae TaxID=1646373 RepID=A0ABX3TXR1_9GAMM|nr:hypothetical protein [Rouxiella silvae]ORJ19998.1 hypothetical protein BS639_17030 [Rouxiella silvae]